MEEAEDAICAFYSGEQQNGQENNQQALEQYTRVRKNNNFLENFIIFLNFLKLLKIQILVILYLLYPHKDTINRADIHFFNNDSQKVLRYNF